MKKPRVIFPFTEAGLGHIMPMNSVADEFERLYGDKVEVVRSDFFKETGDKKLIEYERLLSNYVVQYNKKPSFGFFATFNMDFWGTKISSWGAINVAGKGAFKKGVEHMTELAPDLVFSTHWATNYYAAKMKTPPLTAMYCPDAKINTLFRYPCNLALSSMSTGYERALKKHKRRFNKSNLKKVPFLIRKEAFDVSSDKKLLRRELGMREDLFTVFVADGGYGIGKMQKTCEELIERDLPINLIAVCGKNEKAFSALKDKNSKGNTVIKVYGLTDDIFKLIAASDISCGKSGASLMAEPCFFGVPQLITHYANDIERWIGKYYLNAVGSAIKEFNVKKACDLIEKFVAYPALLQPYKRAAENQRENYGANICARYVFGLLCTRFPELKDGTELY